MIPLKKSAKIKVIDFGLQVSTLKFVLFCLIIDGLGRIDGDQNGWGRTPVGSVPLFIASPYLLLKK
ncbi:hypothetical protein Lwal_1750 [Legionella waltersii]|uniref:Uncharacterized protein n=1 Tax=Legionella waltersii TaxID=66969 RepID=A0A0W1AAI7_9GAMM|nr:hypothetical protein Lwal_1750 [Legionella waltersii]SNV08753.1 Uncharacterised protein [Legionella waltersii]